MLTQVFARLGMCDQPPLRTSNHVCLVSFRGTLGGGIFIREHHDHLFEGRCGEPTSIETMMAAQWNGNRTPCRRLVATCSTTSSASCGSLPESHGLSLHKR